MAMNMKKTNRNAATPPITSVVWLMSANRKREFISTSFNCWVSGSLQDFDKVLRAHYSRNADRLAGWDWRAIFSSRRRRVARAALHIGDLAYAIFRDRCHDRSRQAGQRTHARFARALRLFEHPVEQQESHRCHAQPGHGRDWRADPNAFRPFDSAQDQPASAKSGDKARQYGRTEERNPRHATVIIPRFGMAAGADIHLPVMPAEEVPCDGADDREQQTKG